MLPDNRKREKICALEAIWTEFWTGKCHMRIKPEEFKILNTFCWTPKCLFKPKFEKFSLKKLVQHGKQSHWLSNWAFVRNTNSTPSYSDADKKKQIPNMTDYIKIQKNGATMKSVIRCKPTWNVCATTKSRKSRHFI